MSEVVLLLRNQCKLKYINIRIKVEIYIQLISQDLKATKAQFEAYKWKEISPKHLNNSVIKHTIKVLCASSEEICAENTIFSNTPIN